MFGNDLATFPNFPAEIRAPQGTLAGVSSFQLHFADHDILTPGDRPDVLVAMNPAALKANLGDMPKGATLILDTHDFTTRALARIGWTSNPLEDGTLDGFQVHALDLTELTLEALKDQDLSRKDAGRSKNMFALGLLSLDVLAADRGNDRRSSRRSSRTSRTSRRRTSQRSAPATTSATRPRRSPSCTRSSRRRCRAGTYRNITGNLALAYGLIAASQAQRPAAVPRRVPDHAGVGHPARAVQAQAFRRTDVPGRGRDRRHRRSTGRGVRRRARGDHVVRPRHRAQGRDDRPRRVSLELPLIICDIQRGGPSTGLPTKTEQSDLLQAMFGRNGEAPVPVVARAVARRLLRRCDRGRADRADVPHAGVPALGRLPRQRLRAVAGAVRRGPARPVRRVRHRAQRRGRRVPAVPA